MAIEPTTPPDIDALPATVPNRNSDTPAQFSNNTDAYLAAQLPFKDQLNAMSAWTESTAQEVYDNATATAALSNYVGDWPDLTGALNIPASVSDGSDIYILRHDIADITLSQPSSTPADWVKSNDNASSRARAGSSVAPSFTSLASGITNDGVLSSADVAYMHANSIGIRTEVNNTVSNSGGARYKILTTAEKDASDYAGTELYACIEINGYGYWACLADLINIDVTAISVTESSTASSNYNAIEPFIRNFGASRRTVTFPPGDFAFDLFNPNNCVLIGSDTNINLEYNAAKSVTLGQFTNVRASGLNFNSQETDLENQKCQASDSYFEFCKFTGFRNPTNSNSWGMYLKDQSNVTLYRCGFDDNTQSDIAIVDDVLNVRILNCYAIDPDTDTLHINCEPNASTFENSVYMESMAIGDLYLLENGSGSTASKSITVKNCQIGKLTYDGSTVSFEGCSVASYDRQTEIFGGKISSINSIGLGTNLLPDPFMLANSFNQAQGLSNDQIWYMRTRSGSITGGGRTLLNENGIRSFGLNYSGISGVIAYSLVTDLTVTIGKTYCIALTARGRSNNGASHLIIENNGTITTRSHRQSADAVFGFSTEFFFFTATATALNFKVQNSTSTSTEGVDIKAITLHEVIPPRKTFAEVLDPIHGAYGNRELFLSALPVTNPVDQTGFQIGDKVTTTTKTYAWDGTALQALW